jgi:hypothetical protein
VSWDLLSFILPVKVKVVKMATQLFGVENENRGRPTSKPSFALICVMLRQGEVCMTYLYEQLRVVHVASRFGLDLSLECRSRREMRWQT